MSKVRDFYKWVISYPLCELLSFLLLVISFRICYLAFIGIDVIKLSTMFLFCDLLFARVKRKYCVSNSEYWDVTKMPAYAIARKTKVLPMTTAGLINLFVSVVFIVYAIFTSNVDVLGVYNYMVEELHHTSFVSTFLCVLPAPILTLYLGSLIELSANVVLNSILSTVILILCIVVKYMIDHMIFQIHMTVYYKLNVYDKMLKDCLNGVE